VQDLFLDIVKAFKLQKIIQRLLGLITGVIGLSILNLARFIISEGVSVSDGKILSIINAILCINNRIKDLVKPAGELIVS
jgi:hypothetical protein